MPSTEECIEAQNRVEDWYLNHLRKTYPGVSTELLYELCRRTSYSEKRDLYVKKTKAWDGPYSAL